MSSCSTCNGDGIVYENDAGGSQCSTCKGVGKIEIGKIENDLDKRLKDIEESLAAIMVKLEI